jgi:hypothetical protein
MMLELLWVEISGRRSRATLFNKSAVDLCGRCGGQDEIFLLAGRGGEEEKDESWCFLLRPFSRPALRARESGEAEELSLLRQDPGSFNYAVGWGRSATCFSLCLAMEVLGGEEKLLRVPSGAGCCLKGAISSSSTTQEPSGLL